MDKGSNARTGKIIPSGHSTRVEGLNRFLDVLASWPEVTSIRIGAIVRKKKVGRRSKKLKTDAASETGLRAASPHKRAKGGGGFSFKATRLAMIGSRPTGINCLASNGTNVQHVVLTGSNLDALKARLKREGYGANW